MDFSEKLCYLRKQQGWSQEQLGEKLKVPQELVAKWETQQTLPDPEKIIQIGDIFGVSAEQLLTDELTVTSQAPMENDKNEGKTAALLSSVVESDIIFCPKCGKENHASSAFCGYCGNSFPAFDAKIPENTDRIKTNMDWAYYKANLQMQQQALQLKHQELEEARRQTKQQQQQLRLQQKQHDDMMRCPYCGSTSLSGNKKGYGIGKGVIGASLFGPLGLIAGNIGASKITVTCMKCGRKFKPGEAVNDSKNDTAGCIGCLVFILLIILIGVLTSLFGN